jgi:hypothetical protein
MAFGETRFSSVKDWQNLTELKLWPYKIPGDGFVIAQVADIPVLASKCFFISAGDILQSISVCVEGVVTIPVRAEDQIEIPEGQSVDDLLIFYSPLLST